MTNRKGFSTFMKAIDKFIEYFFMHDDSTRCTAPLTCRQESTQERLINCDIHLGIIPNDSGVLATHFKRKQLPMLLQSILLDPCSDLIGSRKKNGVDPFMNTKT